MNRIIRKEAGRFILATNLVEQEKLEPKEILKTYKNQQSCERGFRFLKDPLFFADGFFVENTERIELYHIDLRHNIDPFRLG